MASRRRNKSFLRVRVDPPRDDAEELGWWERNSKLTRDWLRSNPLKLGIDDDAIGLIRQMLRRGDVDRCVPVRDEDAIDGGGVGDEAEALSLR